MKNCPKIKDWCVYAHILPNKQVYFGITNNPKIRWVPSLYKKKSLYPYIGQYGWENIKHIVIQDGLTKEQAKVIEGVLIKQGKIDDLCINKNNSGYYCKDYNNYMREYMRNYRNNKKL